MSQILLGVTGNYVVPASTAFTPQLVLAPLPPIGPGIVLTHWSCWGSESGGLGNSVTFSYINMALNLYADAAGSNLLSFFPLPIIGGGISYPSTGSTTAGIHSFSYANALDSLTIMPELQAMGGFAAYWSPACQVVGYNQDTANPHTIGISLRVLYEPNM